MSDPVPADRNAAGTAENARRHRLKRVCSGLITARRLWAVTLAAVLGDLVSTLYGIHTGLAEQNPVVAAVLVEYGALGLVALKAVAVGWAAGIWWALGRVYGMAALAGLFLPQAIAVGLNVVTILSA